MMLQSIVQELLALIVQQSAAQLISWENSWEN